jgi:hypothetical protein
MHYFHRIVVIAENEEEAKQEAESAIKPFGEGDVWDWYTVGGRWSGALSGGDAISLLHHREEFIDQLKKVAASQSAEVDRVSRVLSGRMYGPEDVPDWSTKDVEKLAEADGGVSGRTREWLDRNNEMLKKDSAEMQQLLGARTLHALHEAQRGLAEYRLRQFLKYGKGAYQSNSYFLDARNYGEHTANPLHLLYAIEEKEPLDPWRESSFDEGLVWMVGIDLHN